MTQKRFDSVWDAIEDTPEDAENMKLRSSLMIVLKERPLHNFSIRSCFIEAL